MNKTRMMSMLQKMSYQDVRGNLFDAFYREKQIQGWSRKKKEALINRMPDKLHELAKCMNESSHLNVKGGFGSAQPPVAGKEQGGGGAQPPVAGKEQGGSSAQPPVAGNQRVGDGAESVFGG